MSRELSIKLPNTLTELAPLLDKLQRALTCVCLNSAGLAIGSSDKEDVLIANTVRAYIEGSLVAKTTAEIVLSGTVSADQFNVYVLSIDSAGDVVATMGTEAATLGGVVFPDLPDGSAMIGFVIVNPTGTGNFVGGTTELDDATVVPNAVYVNTPFPILPNKLETL